MKFKKFDIKDKSKFSYWFWHWLAYNYTAVKLHAWKDSWMGKDGLARWHNRLGVFTLDQERL